MGLIPEISSADKSKSPFSNDFCGSSNSHDRIKKCSQKYLDSKSLEESFNEICKGRNQCEINLVDYVNTAILDTEKECVSDLSTVYIQYTCDFKDVY